MSKYYGKTNAIVSSEGGGESSLNIAYGLTPPSDTSKIWVRTSDEPSEIRVEGEYNKVISTKEVAKQITNLSINNTYLYSGGTQKYLNNRMVKIDSRVLIASGADNSSYCCFDGSTFYSNGYVRIIAGNSKSDTYIGLYAIYSMWKYSYNKVIVFGVDSSNNFKAIIMTLGSGTSHTDETIQLFTSGYQVAFYRCCFANDTIYGIELMSSGTFYVRSINLTKTSSKFRAITLPNDWSYSNTFLSNAIYINGYLYLLVKNFADNKVYMCRLDASLPTTTNLEVLTECPLNISFDFYQINSYYNTIVLTNFGVSSDSTSAITNKILLFNTEDNTFEQLTLDNNYCLSYVYVDEANGDIEIYGGYPTAQQKRKIIISRTWTLTENTLDLFYDKNVIDTIRLINEETLTMDAPINHCWLGDSNNIAQSVNMYYYDNGTWKGINCQDYTE